MLEEGGEDGYCVCRLRCHDLVEYFGLTNGMNEMAFRHTERSSAEPGLWEPRADGRNRSPQIRDSLGRKSCEGDTGMTSHDMTHGSETGRPTSGAGRWDREGDGLRLMVGTRCEAPSSEGRGPG